MIVAAGDGSDDDATLVQDLRRTSGSGFSVGMLGVSVISIYPIGIVSNKETALA
jgi:hypothetical protein